MSCVCSACRGDLRGFASLKVVETRAIVVLLCAQLAFLADAGRIFVAIRVMLYAPAMEEPATPASTFKYHKEEISVMIGVVWSLLGMLEPSPRPRR